ncbi:MAG: hypothetical protein JXA73_18530 [Acidobacteria bacterium]|nr:hypothetical protein [Acidobacteriota bacterium]
MPAEALAKACVVVEKPKHIRHAAADDPAVIQTGQGLVLDREVQALELIGQLLRTGASRIKTLARYLSHICDKFYLIRVISGEIVISISGMRSQSVHEAWWNLMAE